MSEGGNDNKTILMVVVFVTTFSTLMYYFTTSSGEWLSTVDSEYIPESQKSGWTFLQLDSAMLEPPENIKTEGSGTWDWLMGSIVNTGNYIAYLVKVPFAVISVFFNSIVILATSFSTFGIFFIGIAGVFIIVMVYMILRFIAYLIGSIIP